MGLEPERDAGQRLIRTPRPYVDPAHTHSAEKRLQAVHTEARPTARRLPLVYGLTNALKAPGGQVVVPAGGARPHPQACYMHPAGGALTTILPGLRLPPRGPVARQGRSCPSRALPCRIRRGQARRYDDRNREHIWRHGVMTGKTEEHARLEDART